MGDYSYLAVDKLGKQKKGSIKAGSVEEAKERLKADGLTPIKVSAQNLLTRDIKIGGDKKVKTRDLAVFCRQFAGVLRASVTVVEGLKLLAEQTENPTLKKALTKTAGAVRQGNSLADAMRQSPKVFPPMLVNMVEAGEASGTLDTCIARMGIQFEKSAKIKALVKKAMTYPIVLLVISFGVMIFMSLFIVPQFAKMFAEMGAELPWTTQTVMNFSGFIMSYWYILLLIVAAIVLGIRMAKKTERGQEFFGKLAIKAPIFGKFNVKSSAASFSRTMSTLLSSGMNITQAIDIAANAMGNIVYTKALRKAKIEVEQGVPLSQPIKRAEVFPAMVPNMMAIGEETGGVADMLDRVAEYYEEETEIAAGTLTEMLQPIIIVIIGAMVGFLVLAMYQPMISMYQEMGNM